MLGEERWKAQLPRPYLDLATWYIAMTHTTEFQMGCTAENTAWPLEPLFGPFYVNLYLRLDPGVPGWNVECKNAYDALVMSLQL